MDQTAEIFARYFESWDITLPAEAIENRQRGEIQSRGWTIHYLFGSNERGEFLDFYAAHRMTNDRHERIYTSGETESLPAIQDWLFYPENATKAQKKQAEREYREHNERVAEELKKKGFR